VTPSQRDPVLLVVDDDQDIVETICAIGERAGFRTVSSTSSGRLRELVDNAKPDAIVLDLQMPGDDGVSALRYLADARCTAKILLVTGMDERTIASAEQYGLRRGLAVVGAVQKPFDPDELRERLEKTHASIRPLTGADLAHAIDNGELVVYYQPIIRRFADNTWDVAAVEALLRWNHPIRGLLTPDAFISMGEAHDLSRAMTDFVLQRGVEQLKGWEAQRLRLGLRVNVSATLIADVGFPDRLERLLIAQSVDPDSLALEITETTMLEQTPEAFDILTRLRIKEIGLSIDDFGTGYSSLTQLFRMPFNEMKIDRSLVSRISESKEASIMVDALIALAHKLNLTACAEGVEDRATLEALGRFGADFAQGYYVSTPVPAAEIPRIVAHWDGQQRHAGPKLRTK
jgi:EAL domain-containing protein (putative c-di-GMP-specific phosphodiesterase class I)/ActR/RegA family two-component response regulator